MDISNWSVEDFVLDPGFKSWVLHPDRNDSVLWEEHLEKNPQKLEEIKQAREILLNLSSKSFRISPNDKNDLWTKIEEECSDDRRLAIEPGKIIPLNSYSTIRRKETREKDSTIRIPQFYRIAGILLICFILSFLLNTISKEEKRQSEVKNREYIEHVTQPGVKSSLTLTDGTKVIMNSGSKIYYEKYFRDNNREVFLEGEAQFDVFKDPEKPFIVHTGNIATTALGTSFNINAYGRRIDVYLLSGKVRVMDKSKGGQLAVQLEKGESAHISMGGNMLTDKFNAEKVSAWTKGVIVFDKTPVIEALEILENWFGVTFEIQNKPIGHVTVSGKFDNETLKNILIGLSYSARFEFDIIDDNVKIHFTN